MRGRMFVPLGLVSCVVGSAGSLAAATGSNDWFPSPPQPHFPPWPATYNMSMSTITMQCNSSGWSSPTRGAQFGIVSYDWSNAKKQWAASKPMDCEERLLEQAQMTKKVNPDAHVFVYRNVVKALPWFTKVREKLDDPQYSGWFLRFRNDGKAGPYHVPVCAPEDASKCSVFYHDQEQTPEVPTPAQPNPDGSCTDGQCDCGKNPCGEYLFDHRNGTMLRTWIVEELIGGNTGVDNPAIDGLFIDDYWCSDVLCKEHPDAGLPCPCHDPVQGPTEEDKNSQADMGLSDQDIADLTMGWRATMDAVKTYMLTKAKAYTWSLIAGQAHANASPKKLSSNAASCAAELASACSNTSEWQTEPQLFGLNVNGSNLTQVNQDMAFFLLARGPYAWAGWGVWGMTWPFNPEPAHGELPPLPHGVPRPSILDVDYGMPEEICHEVPGKKGAFARRWTKASVTLDCTTFTGTIEHDDLGVLTL